MGPGGSLFYEQYDFLTSIDVSTVPPTSPLQFLANIEIAFMPASDGTFPWLEVNTGFVARRVAR